MRRWIHPPVLLLALALSGCAHNQKTAPVFQPYQEPGVGADTNSPPANVAPAAPAEHGGLIVTPVEGLNAKVTRMDSNLKYVVLTFPLGQMARLDQRLNISRRGLKVGEVKVVGPQLNNSIIADIVAGDAQVGDDASDK